MMLDLSRGIYNMNKAWFQWALGDLGKPSFFLDELRSSGIIFYPELYALINCPQQLDHHPEGTVYNHTMMVCDEAAEIAERENLHSVDRIILMFAALTHDFGKPATTVIYPDGRVTAHGHPQEGFIPALQFLTDIGVAPEHTDHILPLVTEHMAHIGHFVPEVTTRSVRRLLERIKPSNLYMLSLVMEADSSGRGGKYYKSGLPERMKEIIHVAENIDMITIPDYIINGDVLISLGFVPSKEFGQIKEAIYMAQLKGEFSTLEEGIAWVVENIIRS
jgi:tRNA nucleotidyltransferase (CCA-adding enzyme)